MPRKKTVQPEPLEIIDLGEGHLAEVRDDTCQEIGRGKHKTHEYLKKHDRVLEMVMEDYFIFAKKPGQLGSYKGRSRDDYLGSAKKFLTKLELEGWQGEEGRSLDWNRRKLYPDICMQVRVFRNALEEARYVLPPN